MALPVHGLLERILATAKTALFRDNRNVFPSLASPIQIFLQHHNGLLAPRPPSDHHPNIDIPDPRRYDSLPPRQILLEELDQIQNQKTFQRSGSNPGLRDAPKQDSDASPLPIHAPIAQKLPTKRLQHNYMSVPLHQPPILDILRCNLHRNWL